MNAVVDVAALTGQLEELLQRHDVPGAAVAVTRGDATTAAAAGVLSRDTGDAATTESVFQIGSITKVMTVTLMMQLADEGRVDLNRPVSDYLPEFETADPAASASIRVRHLLNHSSGIDGDYFADFGDGDNAVAEYVSSLRDIAQLHSPGAMFSYSNSGFVVAGRIIEQVLGETFDDAIARRLLDPLAVPWSRGPHDIARFASTVGHLPGPGGAPVSPVGEAGALPRAMGSAGSTISMTAAGVAEFARLHLNNGIAHNGVRLLSERSAEAMRRETIPAPPGTVQTDAMGLGWVLFDSHGVRFVRHNGATVGQLSFIVAAPEHGVSVSILTNSSTGGALARELLNSLIPQLTGVSLPQPPVPPPSPRESEPEQFVGRYRRHALTEEVLASGAGLLIRTTADDQGIAMRPPGTVEQEFLPLSSLPGAEVFVSRDATQGAHSTMTFLRARDGSIGYLHRQARVAVRENR